jgi:hypothetical protein
MVGACITVASIADYKPVWTGNPPADFAADMAGLQTDYGNVTVSAAQADAATGGGGDASAAAETTLENVTFVLARALANHYKKNGDLDNLGKVDVTKTEIIRLRKQDLVDRATAIKNLANAAVTDPAAAGRGVTAARIATITAAITAFSNVMNTPRGQVVNKSALLREVETAIAGLVEDVTAWTIWFCNSPAAMRPSDFRKHGNAPASSLTAAADTAAVAHRPYHRLRPIRQNLETICR